jgi:Ca2+-binding EF-hand superfamily protein
MKRLTLPALAVLAFAAPAALAQDGASDARQDLLKRFDANGDGELTGAERDKARAAWDQEQKKAQDPAKKKEPARRGDDKQKPQRPDDVEPGDDKPAAKKPETKKRGADDEGQPQDGQKRGEGVGEQRRKALLAKYDKNKNGKLDPEERAAVEADRKKTPPSDVPSARHEALLAKYDTNKNGKLDPDEAKAARAELRGGDEGDPKKGDPKKGDTKKRDAKKRDAKKRDAKKKGPGITPESRAETLKKWDKNGDGTLDEAERKAMRDADAKGGGGR